MKMLAQSFKGKPRPRRMWDECLPLPWFAWQLKKIAIESRDLWASAVSLFLSGSPLALKELTKGFTFLYNFLYRFEKTKMSFLSSLAILEFLIYSIRFNLQNFTQPLAHIVTGQRDRVFKIVSWHEYFAFWLPGVGRGPPA